jgi:tRNA pseudouridine55 synthase
MDGLLILNKPVGLTSAKALYRVRRLTGQRKSGHAGTLDPAADGVLIICLGKGTKLVEGLMDLPKVYRTTARLDLTSPSFDSESETTPVPVPNPPSQSQVIAALQTLQGRIEQVPPAISALKVGGRPAYKLTRAGQPPALAARPVDIYWIYLHHYAFPTIQLEIACGRGTYIRALIRDLGAALHTGGCLTQLTRTAIGPWDLTVSWSLAQLEAETASDQWCIPLERAREIVNTRPVVVPAPPGS